MEENQRERFDNSLRGTAEIAVVAYIAVKAFQGVTASVRDAVCFVNSRKANKAAEEKK